LKESGSAFASHSKVEATVVKPTFQSWFVFNVKNLKLTIIEKEDRVLLPATIVGNLNTFLPRRSHSTRHHQPLRWCNLRKRAAWRPWRSPNSSCRRLTGSWCHFRPVTRSHRMLSVT
jgi:hypothetical protein